ncbi:MULTISPECIES: hypothetical protein [Heyndrickxia]|nr:hypothetical protein [Heyndrickxia sporothermodurans]MED3655909.1 hypothetical protein [Heyndrickxia sporothermodurans]
MKKVIFYTILCEKIGLLSKEETTKILKNNSVSIIEHHLKNENQN